MDEDERLKTIYKPTPLACTVALDVLRLLGHRTAAAWTRFNPDDDPTTVCAHCNTSYVLGGSYGAPLYYLNVRTEDPGKRGELFDAAVVLYFGELEAVCKTARELVKSVPSHFYCKKIETFL